jgi:hypothetical protein
MSGASREDDLLRRIADATLYRGCPPEPFNGTPEEGWERFGAVSLAPPEWDERSGLQAEVLLEGEVDGEVEVNLRFLQLAPWEGDRSGGYELIEREAGLGAIEVPGGEDRQSTPRGSIRRSWVKLTGQATIARELLRPDLTRLSLRVLNTTELEGTEVTGEISLRRTLISAHLVLRASQGRWVSANDPPPQLRAAADTCENVGVWPALLQESSDRATVLAAPIVLPDHPERILERLARSESAPLPRRFSSVEGPRTAVRQWRQPAWAAHRR